MDYDERVLPSIGNEVLKSIVAQFDAAELITQREVVRLTCSLLTNGTLTVHAKVSSRIRADLLQRAGEFNIKLEDVSITNLTFGKARCYIPVCWSKLIPRYFIYYLGIHASRRGQANRSARYISFISVRLIPQNPFPSDAERAKFIVEKAEQERQAAVIRAEGEAEAAATISRALEKAGEAFVAFRKIEASKAIVQSLANNPNVTYIPSGGGNVLLNVPTNK